MFTTSKLAKTICAAPRFPEDQLPSLTTRDLDAYQHIVLAPLPLEGSLTSATEYEDGDDEDEPKPVPQSLNLTFHFKSKQDEQELKKLAYHLKKFMKLNETTLHKVQWGGIWSGSIPRGQRLRELVSKVMAERSPLWQRPSSLSSQTGDTSSLTGQAPLANLQHEHSSSTTEYTPFLLAHPEGRSRKRRLREVSELVSVHSSKDYGKTKRMRASRCSVQN